MVYTVGFITEILLDLDQLACIYQRDNLVAWLDFEEYFKLTVDFYFDRSRSSEYRL